jgi:hypothetical protein
LNPPLGIEVGVVKRTFKRKPLNTIRKMSTPLSPVYRDKQPIRPPQPLYSLGLLISSQSLLIARGCKELLLMTFALS